MGDDLWEDHASNGSISDLGDSYMYPKKQQCSINPSASQVSWRLNIGFGEQSGEPPVKKKDQKIDVYVHGAGHVLTPAKKSTFPDGLKRIILNPTITRVLFR